MAADREFEQLGEQHADSQRAREAFARADAWAKAQQGTPYGETPKNATE